MPPQPRARVGDNPHSNDKTFEQHRASKDRTQEDDHHSLGHQRNQAAPGDHDHRYGILPVETSDSTSIAGTSASYVDGSPIVAVTCVVPPNGSLYVSVTARVSAGNAQVTYEIRDKVVGGTVIQSSSNLIGPQLNANELATMRDLVTGLAPGTAVYITCMHRYPTSSGTVNHRKILVEPVP